MSKPKPLSICDCAEKAKYLYSLVDAIEVITRMQADSGNDEIGVADKTVPHLAWIALDMARDLELSLNAHAEEAAKQSYSRGTYDYAA